MSGHTRRIEICGGIASGKTTLARILTGNGVVGVFENFRTNPFYTAFYRDPCGTAFETEITFLLQHYHQQKVAASSSRTFCADFSMILDHAYAAVTLSPAKLKVFRSVQMHAESGLPPRSLLIQLKCPPEIELKRVMRRRRNPERVITLAYLSKINDALSIRAESLPRREKILLIDSNEINFAKDRHAQEEVRARVTSALTDD